MPCPLPTVTFCLKGDSHPRVAVEGGNGSGKSVRLSSGVYEKGTEKDMVIMVDWRHSEEMGFYFMYLV